MNRQDPVSSRLALSFLTLAVATCFVAPAVAQAQTGEGVVPMRLAGVALGSLQPSWELSEETTYYTLVDAQRHRRRGGLLLGTGISLAVAGGVSLGLFGLTWGHFQSMSEGTALWLAGSIAATTVGLLLTGLGAWQRARGNKILRRLASLQWSVTPGGASVGWAGEF